MTATCTTPATAGLRLGAKQDQLLLAGKSLLLAHGQEQLPAQPQSLDAWIALRARRWPARQREDLPRLLGETPSRPFGRCPQQLGFYPVVPDADWVKRLLDLGVKTIQLRLKSDDRVQVDRAVRDAVVAGEAHGARLFINDHWQAALHAGAYGVHLGQEDLHGTDLERLSLSGIRLGISNHGDFELVRALALRPSYIAFGAIFATPTKQMPTAPQGLRRLRHFCRLLDGLPTVAIGGIDLGNAEAVLAQGPGSLAVVRAVTESSNLKAEVGRWLALCGS
ncbi:thiamine phosphate synthase [Gallaecimonas kandeliae]|uniref:thiamine phosphate synthase n=1 Tax=Gallaecimonas kandeliae TaxID=3029055 RepID=UPI002647F593|nr:thiamine phosphate synthase [Gallaecimonas kandeliae]WKE65713.1 thiamine phosphate synthase [Gallaecimonas kandeliae]